MDKQKRILWLYNHTSCRNTQVPMLIDMGYEVYCPKIYSYEWGDYSASVTYEYDVSLSIPQDVIDYLNTLDFYQEISGKAMDIINSYFGIAICMALPSFCEIFTRYFDGVVAIQGVGLVGNNISYTEVLTSTKTVCSLGKMACIRNKISQFFMLFSYLNLKETECELIKNRSLYMPLAMKDATPKRKWQGGDKKVLFIAPKIKTNSYYNNVYKNFCDKFGDLPHIIGGAQLQDVTEDKTVKGFLPDDEYVYNMTHLAAMFYHSQEPRHIHYHPLEAVKWGMPLIFMSGGMLDQLGGKDLPGRAVSIADAKRKLKKLLAGDKGFIKKVTESQEILLRPFTEEYCRPFWEEGMKKIETAAAALKEKRRKRIAVILPAAYIGGVYDYAIRFCLDLQEQITAHKANAEVVFAYPKNEIYEKKDYFASLRKKNIHIREFTVETKGRRYIDDALEIAGYQPKLHKLPFPDKVAVLRDGMKDFGDCDYAFFMSDAVDENPLFFLCPYTMIVHDYIQRYVPEAVSQEADTVKCYNQRQAMSVFVTSEPTRQDAINHGCIEPERVVLTPPLLAFPTAPKIKENNNGSQYLLWSTNPAPHKNHIKALTALEAYYQKGGFFNCVITGFGTKYFLPNASLDNAPVLKDYVEEIQQIIEDSDYLQEKLIIKGNMMKKTYEQWLCGASFVFHPGYGDNGNFTVTDAAALGVPALASSYPAMRYLADFAGITVKYFDPFDVEDIVGGLFEMEQGYRECANMLPSRDVLERKTFSHQAYNLYQLIKEQIPFEEDL